jgi:hypothetical protein
MTYPVWPDDLRRFEREGWQIQPQNARQRRQSDAGPPGWRRRFSAVARTVSLSLILTRNEKAVFDRFYSKDCAEGARLFWMPDMSTDGWPLLDSAGVPLLSNGVPILLSARWLCSFGEEPPVETIVEQVKFRKIFTVVVMP